MERRVKKKNLRKVWEIKGRGKKIEKWLKLLTTWRYRLSRDSAV